MKFFSFWRSLASFRARIALNLKNLPAEVVFVDLDANANRADAYAKVNPQMALPSLVLDDGTVLFQSLAILEYLEETHPTPPLLPADPLARAKVRALAQVVACDIHPLNNVGPLRHLKNELGQDQSKIDAWYHHWVAEGFEALEALMEPAPYAFGSQVTLADLCLVPQVYNARRLKVPLERFPKVVAVDAACAKLAAFEQARPENQLDAE